MTGAERRILLMVLTVAFSAALAAAPEPPKDAPAEPALKLTEKPVKSLGKIDEKAWEPLLINSTGTRMAYVLPKGEKKAVVVCDGKEGREYETVGQLQFSPDGRRFVYSATSPKANFYVLDGAEVNAPGPQGFAFSPDSNHTVYCANDEVFRDGRKETGDSFGRTKPPVFSPDSLHCAYIGRDHIVCDGKNGKAFLFGAPGVKFGEVVFTPDSKSYAFSLRQGEKIGDKWVVFWGDAKFGPYDIVEGIVFSPDSRRLTFRAMSGGKWSVIVNNKKGPDFSALGAIVFSSDNKHMAYRACGKDGWVVVLDGKAGPACTDLGDPVFSSDGKHIAYRAVKDGKSLVVCDGRESASFDQITCLGFTPNSNHLAFAAVRGNDKFVVCDGVEGPPHERLMVPERPFEVASKVRYVVIEKAEASLVEVDWPADRLWENAFRPAAK